MKMYDRISKRLVWHPEACNELFFLPTVVFANENLFTAEKVDEYNLSHVFV